MRDCYLTWLQFQVVRMFGGNVRVGIRGLQLLITEATTGADAHIALAIGENVEQNFYHELCHVLDAFIYANSRDLDVWDTLNPKGFAYDYSYELYQNHGTEYLEGKDQAFVDAFSRTYPKEDRARVWEYALMPDNEAFFDSEIMQNKLYLLSFSIRDAFNWKKDTRAFPWETYLEEPLAYVKK